MDRKHTVFLTIIAVATLLVAVVGATFAYFTTSVTGNASASVVEVKTASLGIVYTSGQDLILGNDSSGVVPGATASTTFTVKNNGEVPMTYNVKWAAISNSFDAAHLDELVYTLTNDAGLSKTNVTMPTAAGAIENTITIPAGATHSYTLVVTFRETGSEQNYNQNKSFSGKIEVEANAVSA